MKVSFGRNQWNMQPFERITSLRTDCRVPFMQEEDCVVNDVQRDEIMSHNYISLLSRESFELPLRISVECSFDKFGAPVLVMSDDIIAAEDGFPAYGHHFEVVAYENGINVWELNGKDKPVKLGFLEFPVPAGERFLLQADLSEKFLTARLLGRELALSVPTMPSRLRAGFTACEGVNRFYTLCIS